MTVKKVVELLRSGELQDQYKGLVKIEIEGPFWLLNYTRDCTYRRAWDEVTRACRGLIIDTRDWSVAALPFPKFFNLGEIEETRLENLPAGPFSVTEKIDGSLGILWRTENGNFRISTRGRFYSKQARWGTEFLQTLPNLKTIPEDYTLIFEIVYKKNKTVIKYPFQGLVLLAVMNRRTGEEFPFEKVQELASVIDVPTPKTYYFSSVEDVRENAVSLPGDSEGYVLRFENGLRVKAKGTEYLRLHKLYWGFSKKRIIESLRNGAYKEILTELPEEFRGEAEEIGDPILCRAQELREAAKRLFAKAPKKTERKVFAHWVNANAPKNLQRVLFSMLDGVEEKDIEWIEFAVKAG